MSTAMMPSAVSIAASTSFVPRVERGRERLRSLQVAHRVGTAVCVPTRRRRVGIHPNSPALLPSVEVVGNKHDFPKELDM